MKNPENISEYIANESPEVQKVLKKMRAIIRRAAPKAAEKLAWGMPTYHLEGYLVHFAAFKNHMSLFPGPDAMRRFKKEMSAYVTSKGTMQIPYGEAIPTALITRIVKFCVKENLAHAKAKAAAKLLRRKMKSGGRRAK